VLAGEMHNQNTDLRSVERKASITVPPRIASDTIGASSGWKVGSANDTMLAIRKVPRTERWCTLKHERTCTDRSRKNPTGVNNRLACMNQPSREVYRGRIDLSGSFCAACAPR
jgi:hypothetical protein